MPHRRRAAGPSAGRRRRVPPQRVQALLGWAAAIAAALVFALGVHRAAYTLFPFAYRGPVEAAAAQTGLDPRLLLAVMRVESHFRTGAVSTAGAVGLMQITPTTGAWIAAQRKAAGPPFAPALLRQPAYNIGAGAWYLAYLRGAFGGRLPPAVAAYNAGRSPVTAWLRSGVWDATAGGAGAIPFPETRLFVQRVLGTYAVYRLLYPGAGTAERGAS